MNKAYRSIYNEQLGTFVAVAENVKARGKRSSSTRRGALAVAVAGALALSAGGALADGVINPSEINIVDGGSINFSNNGSINFGSGGSITGLAGLTVNGGLTADQLMVGGEQVVTSGQLSATDTQVSSLEGRVGQNETNIATNQTDIAELDGRVDQNKTDIETNQTNISALDGRVGQNEANITANQDNISTINTTLDELGVNSTTAGIKYFRANSEADDAVATGTDSVAIGPNAKSVGDNSLAAGMSAETNGDNSVALGNEASADGMHSLAAGNKASTKGESNIALGDGAKVDNELIKNSTAIGTGATVSGNYSSSAVALGHAAKATGEAATAIGQSAIAGNSSAAIGKSAEASGGSAVAMGNAAKATAGNSLAFGTGAQAATTGSIALGTAAGQGTTATSPNAGLDETHHIAIGTNAGQNIKGNQTTSIGYGAGSGSTGNYSVAVGNLAGQGLDGNSNVSLGHRANTNSQQTVVTHAVALGADTLADSNSTAVGDEAKARGTNSVALGKQATTSDSADSGGGVALGANAKAEGASVALGSNSVASASTGVGFITGFNSGGNNINVVSVGSAGKERRIVNVADGSAGTDAVNVNQLKGAQQNLADILGQGVLANDGKVTSFKVGDKEYKTVAEALAVAGTPGVGDAPDTAGAVKYVAGSNKTLIELEGGGEGTKIKNLADGESERDAVNFGQMNKAIDKGKVKYFSVNSEEPNNRANDGATAADAIAIGPDASATAVSSIAMGSNTLTHNAAESSIAMGTNIVVEREHSVGIGNKVHAYGESNVAIGDGTRSTGANSIAIGKDAVSNKKLPDDKSTVDNAISIGTLSNVTADDGIAMGRQSVSSAERGMAFGHVAEARGVDSIATGTRAKASGVRSMATGLEANASATDSTATGTRAQASGAQSQALGYEAKTYAANGVALGSNTVSGIEDTETDPTLKTFNNNTIAIGNSAQATFQNATATGTGAQATAQSAMASGTDAKATAQNASASGTEAEATAEDAMASGTKAKAGGKNSIATGTDAQANKENAIALGTGAGVAGTGVNSISTGNDASAQGLNSIATGTGARAYRDGSVAIGRSAQAGQGLNKPGDKTVAIGDDSGAFANNSVALGAGSRTNNSYTSSTAAYSNITNNDATSGVVSVGDGGAERRILNVAGGQADTDGVNVAQLKAVDKLLTERGMNFSAESGTDVHRALGETLAIEGTDSNITTSTEPGKINIELAKNLDLGPDGSVKMGDTLVNNSGLTITGGPSITTGGINAGGKVISDVAAGVDGKDAVNVDQLEGVKTTAEKGWNLQTNDKASSTTQVKPGETVNFNEGENIEITQDGLNVTVATAKDVKFENVEITEEVTVAGNTTINKGGITTNNVTSDEIIVNHNGDTINVGETLDSGITFVGDDGNKTEQKLGSELAVAGDENIHTTVEDGKVQVNLDKNLTGLESVQTDTINVGGGTFVAGDNKVTVGTGTTIDMGNNQITNVAAGTGDDHAVNLGQLKKVDETANKGWNLLTNNDHDSLTQVKPGDDVDFRSGDNIEITQDGLNVTVATAKDVKFENVESTTVNVTEELTVANNTTINKGGITSNTLTVIGETKLGDNFHVTNEGDVRYTGPITEGDHIVNKTYVDQAGEDLTNLGLNFAGNKGADVHRNLGQTLDIKGGATTVGNYSSANLQTVTTADGIELQMAEAPKFGDITINNEGKISGVEAGVDDDDAVNVGQLEEGLAAAKTKVEAGKNITVTEDSTDPSVYIVETEDDVDFDSVTSADEAGNKTVLNAKGITIAGEDDTVDPTELGSTKITVGGNNPIVMDGNSGTITGLTNTTLDLPDFGTKGRAATEEQLKLVSNKGLNFSGNYGGDIHKALGEKLEIIGDGEWIYTQEIDGKLHIKLAQNFPVVPNPDVTEGGTPGNGGGTGEGGEGGTPGNGGGGDAPGNGGGVNPPPAAGETPGNIVAGGVIKPGQNITVDKDGDYDLVIGTTPDVNHNSVTVGDVVINKGGISMGGNKITNLAPGVDGTDAVNVDQLDKVKETAEKGWNVSTQGGTATQVKPGDTVDFTNKDGNIVVANNGTNVTVDLAKDIAVDNVQVDNSVTVGGNTNNQTIIKEGNVITNEVIIKRPGNPDGDMNVGETLNKGITFVGSQGQTERKLGDTLEIVGANDNITTKVNGPKGILEIALSNDLALDSVTINNGGPIINDNGINMVDKRITNVADGIDAGDAVNVGQLGKVQDNLQGQVNHLRHDIRRMDKKLSAGVAAAMATAGLPQAYLPGKSMMAMSGGVWNGESGMAIGFSTITDSGKWVVKAAGNATGRGDYGGTVGVGYQW